MSPRLPAYPKPILRAARDVKGWPRPESAPGYYEFDAEIKYASDLHNRRDAGVRKYAEENDLPLSVADTMLEVQVEDAVERVLAFAREVWGE